MSAESPKFLIISILCAGVPNRPDRDILVSKAAKDLNLPPYRDAEVFDLDPSIVVHFLDFDESHNLEVAVVFKAVS